MEHTDVEKNWINFFDNMADGNVKPSSNFYVLEDHIANQQGAAAASSPITLVTPTQQQVQQAESQLKRKLSSKPKAVATKRRRQQSKKPSKKSKKKSPKTKRKTLKTKPRRSSKKQQSTKARGRGWKRK